MNSPVASIPLVTGPNLDIQLLASSVVSPVLSPAPSLHRPLQATWNNKIGQFMKPQQNRNHLTLPVVKIYSPFRIIVQYVFSILQSNENIQMVTCYLLDISTGGFLHGTHLAKACSSQQHLRQSFLAISNTGTWCPMQ